MNKRKRSECRKCKHAVTRYPFYDVKCLKRQHHIYNEDKYIWCEYYEEKKNVKGETNKENDI